MNVVLSNSDSSGSWEWRFWLKLTLSTANVFGEPFKHVAWIILDRRRGSNMGVTFHDQNWKKYEKVTGPKGCQFHWRSWMLDYITLGVSDHPALTKSR